MILISMFQEMKMIRQILH